MMKRKAVLLGLALWAAQSEAAVGSAAADTFYVRPASECTFSGDGMAYNCAASAGASGAWRTSAAVSYTATTGVDDGDTVRYCGDFTEADLDVGSFFILHNAATAASEAGRITFDGDCRSVGGRAFATVTGGSTMTIGFSTAVQDYFTVKNFQFFNLSQAIAMTCVPASSPDGVVFQNIVARGITNTGAAVSINGNPYLIEDIDITTVGEPVFICNGVAGETNGTIRRAVLTSTSTTDPDADGIQQKAGGGAITAENITVYKRNPFKGCGLFGSATGPVRVIDFTCIWEGAPGAAVSGLAIDGSASGGYVRGLWSNAPGDALLLRDDVTAFAGTFDVSGVVSAGADKVIGLDGVHPAGAITISHVSGWARTTGILAESGFNPLSTVLRNVAVDAPTGIDINATVAAADIDIDFVRWGPSVAQWKWRGTTVTTLASYKSTSGKGANDTQGTMGWVGGDFPSWLSGFRPAADSPLIGAGTPILGANDVFGEQFEVIPTIGAIRGPSPTVTRTESNTTRLQ